MRSYFLSVILLFCFGSLSAQTEITLSIEPNRDTITIGDQVTLKVSVTYPKNEIVLFPEFEKELTPGIDLVESFDADTLKSKNKEQKHVEKGYLITSFDAGNYVLDSFPILKAKPNGTLDTIYSNKQISFFVKTIELDDDFQPFDIKDVKNYAGQWWLWILIVTVALILVAVLVMLISRFRKKSKETAKNKIPPYDYAVQKMEKLKKSDLAVSRTKEYYSQLTDIIREYIESVATVPTMEKTSDEILASMPGTVFDSPELIRHIKDLFSIADLVKFAKYPATLMESERSWQHAHNFIEESNTIINKNNTVEMEMESEK